MRRSLAVIIIGLAVFTLFPLSAAQTNALDIQKKTAEPEPLRIGEYATIWFTVYNTDDSTVENRFQ